jgi:murein L,D-transpeptidase YafK
LNADAHIDSIAVYKSKRRMAVYSHNKLLKTYKIALGRQPKGHKQYEGDMRTPEGLYHIYDRNPNSTCYKNLGISYPNERDRTNAKKLGKSPGSNIKIHGLPNDEGYWGKLHTYRDWTYGCIAVTNEEMDELFNKVAIGAPICIMP